MSEPTLFDKVHAKEAERCPHCGSIVSEREISLYSGLFHDLWRVYKWCLDNGFHEFTMGDARDKISKIGYTRFGDLVMFGGLVYKTKKAHYGLNMERCDAFFKDQYSIPVRVYKNPVTGVIRKGEELRTLSGIPHLKKLLDKDGVYQAYYIR